MEKLKIREDVKVHEELKIRSVEPAEAPRAVSIQVCTQHPRPALRHLSAREYAELFWEEA